MFPLLGITSISSELLVPIIAGSMISYMAMDFLKDGVEFIARKLWPPPPPPEKYHINVLNKDGYPISSYAMSREQMSRVVNAIQAEYDTKPRV